jgi:hypothetical protein
MMAGVSGPVLPVFARQFGMSLAAVGVTVMRSGWLVSSCPRSLADRAAAVS